jgi:hypothetical protein
MHEQHPVTEDSQGTKDAYDEFEEGMRRVGVFVSRIWSKLSTSERIGHVTALATLTALVIYAGYTIKLYKANHDAASTAHDTLVEIQKQTKLAHQQVVGAQQAILSISANLGRERGEAGLQIMPNVQGSVPASDIHGTFEITRKSFPALRIIDSDYFEESWAIIPPGIISPAGTIAIRNHMLKNFGPTQQDYFAHSREVIFIDWQYTYNNGFDDPRKERFCMFYLYYTDASAKVGGIPNNCDAFDYWKMRFQREHPLSSYVDPGF